MSQQVSIHKDLVERCRRGDAKAQHELYHAYAQAMYNVAYRIVNDRFEAEDILQECFVTVFRKLDTFRGDSSFGAWLKRVVINRSINTVKRRKMEFDRMDENNNEPVYVEEEETESEWTNYTVADVKKAMAELPEGYRVVFSLFMFEDWSHQEIAEELGITESTSKSQLNRAKKKLKELICMNI
ncbi:MAG: RNA polymerase sigma factor [Flavobacteriales bacterium]|nr:RNA polymerase sigma factor [Flavobacteriales bacterium]